MNPQDRKTVAEAKKLAEELDDMGQGKTNILIPAHVFLRLLDDLSYANSCFTSIDRFRKAAQDRIGE